MARIRTIKPEFWTDEKLIECSLIARLLFIGTWNFADDAGNLDRSPKQIKARIFPLDEIDCEPYLIELISHGLLTEYVVNDKKYLHISGFEKHQLINRPSKPVCPQYELFEDSVSPPAGRERKGKERKVGEEITLTQFLKKCDEKHEMYIAADDSIFEYADQIGIPQEFMTLAWKAFVDKQAIDKKQIDWRSAFRNDIRRGWQKVWAINAAGEFYLTTLGKQLEKELGVIG